MFLALILGFIAGAAFVLAINVLIIYYWLKLKPKEDPKLVPKHVNVCNPKDVADYCRAEGATSSESCMFLNLMFAFLWGEWRDTTKTKSYFIKKMNLEFQELLLNKAAGKLLQQISVKDFCLGDSLPVIKKATVMKIQSRDADQVAQELDVALDIEYSGGFLISLDAELIFGKTAYMAVKLNSLKGRLRLQFTRNPCTHWSFSFYEDPEMDIEVESQFNGKNLARLTTLIKNQIKRSIRRKHTLPRYKVRYKPFFQQPISDDGKKEVFVHNSQVTVGKLDLEVLQCSRLQLLPMNSLLYCNLSIDTLPWNEFTPKNSSLWPVHEVVLARTLSGSVGVTIKQSMGTEVDSHRQMVIIDTISPHSPASSLDIQRGDIILSVNDIDVESMKQAVRLIKNSGEKLNFKLQRPPAIPVINVEGQDVSDAESKDEEMSGSTETQKNDFENSFNFDNVTIDTDDSDGEEFVNIVVQELEQQIAKNDENARKILRKVSLSTKTGKQTRAGSVNFKDQEEGENIEKDETDSFRKTSLATKDQIIQEADETTDNKGIKNNRKNSISSVKSENKSENKENIDIKRDKRTRSIKKNSVEKDNKKLEDEAAHVSEAKKKQSDRLALSRKILHSKDQSIDLDSDSSDSASETSNRTDGDGGWDNISQHTLLNRDACQQLTSQKTSLVSSNTDPSWNESFSFDIEKQHKFLNVCVWSKCEEREGKDVLLGYASIPLMEIALECLSTTSHKHVQSYFLTPSYNRSGVSRTYLRALSPGLKPETCNGDITLAFCYKPNLQKCFLSGEELHEALDGYVDKNEEIREGQESCDCGDKLNTDKMHDFMGTQFYFPTRCDYCQKKVWTKAAFQCRVCAMICHKKCINNAHSNTYCTRMGVRAKPPAWRSEDDTKKSNGVVNKEPLEHKDLDSISLRVPNTDDLRPGLQTKSASSPQLLRRRVVRHADTQDGDEFEHPLQRSFDSRDVDSIATAAETAKKAGKELYSSLEEEDRQEKFERMVQKLQCEIDDENQKRTELCEMVKQISDKDKRAKLQSSVRKSEERSQAFSLLMIQYCAALKECLNETVDDESPE